METYNLIFEALQEKLNNGEITLEKANEVNDLAYSKYVTEGKLMDRIFKKKNKKSVSKITYHQEKVGSWNVQIAIYKGASLPDDVKNQAKEIVKKIDSSISKKINDFVKTQYNDYVNSQMDDEDEKPLSLQEVMSSEKDRLVSFDYWEDKGNLGNYFDIWVSYNNWADSKNSVLAPQVEVTMNVKDSTVKDMQMHLG